jgi:hypothetical protein
LLESGAELQIKRELKRFERLKNRLPDKTDIG